MLHINHKVNELVVTSFIPISSLPRFPKFSHIFRMLSCLPCNSWILDKLGSWLWPLLCPYAMLETMRHSSLFRPSVILAVPEIMKTINPLLSKNCHSCLIKSFNERDHWIAWLPWDQGKIVTLTDSYTKQWKHFSQLLEDTNSTKCFQCLQLPSKVFNLGNRIGKFSVVFFCGK